MWQKDLAAINAAAGEREAAAPPRAVLEARIDQLQKRLGTVEHAARLLTAEVRKQRAFNAEVLTMLGYRKVEK